MTRYSPLPESGDHIRWLFSQGVAQLNLFDDKAARAENDALMTLMNLLNKQGRGTLYFAGQGVQPAW